LAQELLQMWSWGSLTAAMVQKLAVAAVRDGAHCNALDALAAMGAGGDHVGNAHRDLVRLLQRWCPPTTSAVEMTLPLMRTKHTAGVERAALQYLPLHRQLHCMQEAQPQRWEEHVLGGMPDALPFWTSLHADDPRMQLFRPALRERCNALRCTEAQAMQRCIPLALHADGVPAFKGKSLLVLTATSLLGRSSAVDCKLLLEAHWKQQQTKGDTPATDTDLALWRCVLWDLAACWSGTCPVSNYNGEPWLPESEGCRLQGKRLCEGWWAVAWVFKGDWEHFANQLGLAHWTRPNPCPWCAADRADAAWTDFRATAAWKNAVFQPEQWRRHMPTRHPLFTLPYFSVWNIALDVLHVMMGIGQHICGSVLHTLCYTTMTRENAEAHCREIWALVQHWYCENPGATQVSKLPLSAFCDPRAPRARYPMSRTKAKETEYLALALRFVWTQLCNADDAHDQSVAAVLEHCETIYTTARLGAAGAFQLTRCDWEKLTTAIDLMLLHYTALGNYCAERGLRRWNVVLKHHGLWHWGQQARFLHPGTTACYVDEHFCGVVATIVKSSTSGRRIERVGETLLFKWQCGVALNAAAACAAGTAAFATASSR
jgi:hypothetical protein